MTTLRLVDHGYPFKKIMQGRHWVGRVAQKADGSGYVGIIKTDKGATLEGHGATEREAFDEVGARALGYENAAHLRDSNRVVRHRNRVRRAEADYAVRELLRGNFEPFDRALGFPPRKS